MAMSPGIGLQLLTPPTWQPVLVGDMANHSRIQNNNDAENGVLQAFINAAQDYVETATRQKCATQQWLMTMDEFPGRQVDDYRPPTWRYGIIRLPWAPVVSVDQIAYVPPNYSGNQPFPLTVLENTQYQVKLSTNPGMIAPDLFMVWPQTNPLAFEAVQIMFTCGYANAALVPPGMILAIKLLAAHFYEYREASSELAIRKIPLGLQALIQASSIGEYD